MRNTRTRLPSVAALVLLLTGGAAAPVAYAAGVDVFRADSQGNKTNSIYPFPIGTMNPPSTCCCAGAGDGGVGYGVKACYLPIP